MSEKQKKIIQECKDILTNRFVNADAFTYKIEKDDNLFYVFAIRNGKLFFEISDIYADENGAILQYCINVH